MLPSLEKQPNNGATPTPSWGDNMREYATIEQLLVLANIEGMNAELIHMGLSKGNASNA